MEDYTCEQLKAVIETSADPAQIAEAARLFNAKCGAGGPSGQPGGQSGNNTPPPPHP